MYGLIDIGAWTTDISFFRQVALRFTNDGLSTIEFYAAGTYRVAVNEVDERTLRGLFELWDLQELEQQEGEVPLRVTIVRSQRETNQFGRVLFDREKIRRSPTDATLQFARECVRERVLDGVRKTLIQAREKERSESAYQGLRIFVTGGGIRERILWEDIRPEIRLAQSIRRSCPFSSLRALYQPMLLSALRSQQDWLCHSRYGTESFFHHRSSLFVRDPYVNGPPSDTKTHRRHGNSRFSAI